MLHDCVTVTVIYMIDFATSYYNSNFKFKISRSKNKRKIK